ncbi:MAG: glycosyltransferase family 2 protein [Deltaproteobacteria bacterium]|nr:glycosyltransferase family 2 protein [Deltaproteobacteria bacterium]
MHDLSIVVDLCQPEALKDFTRECRKQGCSGQISVCAPEDLGFKHYASVIQAPGLRHGAALRQLLASASSRYLLFVFGAEGLEFRRGCFERLISAVGSHQTVLSYGAHFVQDRSGETELQPLIDYQIGSLRDDFYFGPLVVVDVQAAHSVLSTYGELVPHDFSGWYGLRLGLSLIGELMRVPDAFYGQKRSSDTNSEQEHFEYVDPKQESYQKQLEETFTKYAKLAGFYLTPRVERVSFDGDFPVEASVVVPVKDRVSTISDALESALSQKASFKFNVIVVDNHSSDGTTQIVEDLARIHSNLVHIIPEAHDLGIGGCWNAALQSRECGRFVLQLDSDDLYISERVLETVVSKFRQEGAAVLVGSYKLVDKDLKEVPPGIVDHREWSDENGHNNALRINGFGAPRAFFAPAAREVGFPNVSYGEDYAVMLALTRRYRLARIYEPLYLCRRWEGNSDATPSITKLNGFNYYKDKVRTLEVYKRKTLNGML